ncbi:hypothetical protein KY319_00095 [Candidatus Woesearchaeota archaeon]|nr:hypothetical protein [Candidatus Woesearchaeota archaeon]
MIILLLIFCGPCWRGAKVYGPDGRTYGGGGVYIDACCDGEKRCPPCQPCEPEIPRLTPRPCEEICKERYANYPDELKMCLEKCNPPITCEEKCRKAYPDDPESLRACTERCNPPQTCEERCGQASTSTTQYQACIQQCNPPQTCEEGCREKYSNDPKMFELCMSQECGQTPPPDCRDSDGNNVYVVGVVRYGDQTFRDSCYDATHVIEWTCRDGKPFESRITCATRCLNGACVQQTSTPTTPLTHVPTTTYK